MPYGPKVLARYDDFSFNQGISAEMIAQKWGFSRTRLDEYSAQSHERAAAAQDAGAFEDQIVPVFTDGEPVVADEGIRRGTTRREARRAQAGVHRRRRHPRGQLVADLRRRGGAAGDDRRERGGAGPDPDRALSRGRGHRCRPGADADRSDPGHREGPAQGRAWTWTRSACSRSTRRSRRCRWRGWPRPAPTESKLNPLGGAIALGHPLGASGAVLMTRMIHHMRDNGIRYGLQTMCEGGGTANATLVELIA